MAARVTTALVRGQPRRLARRERDLAGQVADDGNGVVSQGAEPGDETGDADAFPLLAVALGSSILVARKGAGMVRI